MPPGPMPPQGALDDGRHFFPIRVYFEDTDFTGLVYHANYLRFIERARTEMLRELDVHQSAIHAGESGDALFFVVARMQLEFLKPARMDDLLTVETKPLRLTAATIELEQIVRREAEILFTAKVLVAALADGKPRRLPREIREKLALGAAPHKP
ncbi:tol-pal system-associated acyl-CoA thioesterase [Rhodoblastus sp.]|uniref:tol-pal system-associated acyl-CoA thioesterase n=1 Tax=Rhodoblastus sp. TaxID=1962975 RepID=UPI003F9E4A6A